MSNRNGKPAPNGRRPRFDRGAAFAFYVALGPDRSYRKVAAKFHVSEHTIGKWARREEWELKAAALDDKARETVVAEAVRSLEERNRDTIRLVDRFRLMALAADAEEFDLPTIVRALPRYFRHEQLIAGLATDRPDLAETQAFVDRLLAAVADELARQPGTAGQEAVARLRGLVEGLFADEEPQAA